MFKTLAVEDDSLVAQVGDEVFIFVSEIRDPEIMPGIAFSFTPEAFYKWVRFTAYTGKSEEKRLVELCKKLLNRFDPVLEPWNIIPPNLKGIPSIRKMLGDEYDEDAVMRPF